MQDYRKLHVWQKAHKLAIETYALAKYFRRPESWKVRDQIFEAVVSIPAHLAEGRGRGSDADFRRVLWYSNGSCNEFEAEILIARDVSLLPAEVHGRYADDVAEVRRMLVTHPDRRLSSDPNLEPSWKLEAGSWQLVAGGWQPATPLVSTPRAHYDGHLRGLCTLEGTRL